jgi:CRISPR-associated protein Cmr4
MEKRFLYLFTRTPLHVGAGASVGAIDQPIIRERHTGFPVIPATSLKGTFADQWNITLLEQNGKRHLRVTTKKNADNKEELDQVSEAAWLFGSDNANHSFSGALLFSEARLLAFPVRSAKGSFAWITCPLILRRAQRDGVLPNSSDLSNPSDTQALFAQSGPLALSNRVVLEEYTLTHAGDLPANLGATLAGLLDDPVWKEVASRLVILSDGMMSFFAQNACEVAQHVRIDDETGTAAGGALFNQENVPSETLFYSVLHATDERTANKAKDQRRAADQALEEFGKKVADRQVFQFGGDASTGLGWCTVKLANPLTNSTTQQGA